MALSIPSQYRLTDQTTFEVSTGDVYDQSDDGFTRIREIGNTYYVINAAWHPLTITEAQTLMDWLNTNKTLEISVPIDGEVYTCIMVSAPVRSGIGVSRSVSISFRGTKNA